MDFDSKDKNVLFVKRLPYSTNEQEVRDFFDGVIQVRMPKRDDGSIKGFAFLEFSSEEEVEKAMQEKQGAEMGGMSLQLDYTGSKSKKQRYDGGGRGGGGGGGGYGGRNSAEAGQTKVLFVKNLSYDSTEDSLRDAFEGALSARIPTFPDSGKSRGFGFVEFDSVDAAWDAHDAMQGQAIDGRQVVVDFAPERGEGGGRGGGRGGRGGYGGRGGRGGGYGGYGGGRGGGRGRGGYDRGGRY